MKVVICLEKFSDWLEAYSIFYYFRGIKSVTLLYIENARNNEASVRALFGELKGKVDFEYEGTADRAIFFQKIGELLRTLERGDVLAAPYIRYRSIWAYVPAAREKGVTTVHLSESFPDSFNRLGYRLGFRLVRGFSVGKLLKQIAIMPFFYFYSASHKPDVCFYNMAPKVKNPFVKKTIQAFIPKVDEAKKQYLQELTKGEKRPLLIAGFGYGLDKMVEYLKIDKYIATSKDREIIIDGKRIPLDYYICAEEVLLSDCSNRIIGYDSTAICWAYRIGGIEITCYEASALNEQYGFMNGILTRRTMKRCGLTLLPECKEMIKK